MAIEDEPDKVDQYLAENKDIRAWRSIEADRDRELQLALKRADIDGQIQMRKLEAQAATMRLKATSRVEVWRRVLIGLIKLPVLPLGLLLIFILELCNKETPENLDHFLDI